MNIIGNPFVECTSRDMSFREVSNYWCNPFACYSIDYPTLKKNLTPIIIEGPRGSGKTMILKYISYHCQKELLQNQCYDYSVSLLDMFRTDGSIGIYFRYKDNFGTLFSSLNCQQELKNRLFLYYYEMYVLDELFSILSDLEGYDDNGKSNWMNLVDNINSYLSTNCQSIQHFNLWVHEQIDNVDQWIRKSRYIKDSETTLEALIHGDNYIINICKIVSQNIPQLRDIRFLIIIDEYENAGNYQSILNTLLKQVDHTNNISYRIGVRPKGITTLDTTIGSEFLQIDRDFLLYVLQARKMPQYKKFIAEIANRRLSNIPFFWENKATDIRKLLGNTESIDTEARDTVRNSEKHFELLKTKVAPERFQSIVSLLRNPEDPLMEMLNIVWVLRGNSPEKTNAAMNAYIKGIYKIDPSSEEGKLAKKYKLDYSDKYRYQLLFALLGIHNQKKKYYSFNTFAYLSSGAVNDFISLCRNVFYQLDESYYDHIKTNPLIPISKQASGAEDTAIEQMEKIQLCNENGTEMYSFAMNIGGLFSHYHRDVLARYPETNQFAFENEIEIENSPILSEIKNSLIKWGVIVKKPRIQSISIGKRKGTLYYLNRIFCPIFGISYRTRGGFNYVLPTHLFEIILKMQLDPKDILSPKGAKILGNKSAANPKKHSGSSDSDPNQIRFEV